MTNQNRLEARCTTILASLDEQNTRRALKTLEKNDVPYAVHQGQKLLNFSSNDYLGLAGNPSIIKAGMDAASHFGSGGRSSRLVTGNTDLYTSLEVSLATWLGFESALIFPTGYQMNASIWKALTSKDDIIFADKWIHNSLLTGIQHSGARLSRYRHNDSCHLRSLLERESKNSSSTGLKWVCTESIFSMDGDRANLLELRDLCDEFGAILVVDEAHALGVLGTQGQGCGTVKDMEIKLGTFGKAFGCSGAFIAASEPIIQVLISKCDGLKYTTAMPPFVLGALHEALKHIILGDSLRSQLRTNIDEFHSVVGNDLFRVPRDSSHIIPIHVGENDLCLDLAQFFYEHSILAVAIRPPTVPVNTARIRCSLSSVHTRSHFEELNKVLQHFIDQKRS